LINKKYPKNQLYFNLKIMSRRNINRSSRNATRPTSPGRHTNIRPNRIEGHHDIRPNWERRHGGLNRVKYGYNPVINGRLYSHRGLWRGLYGFPLYTMGYRLYNPFDYYGYYNGYGNINYLFYSLIQILGQYATLNLVNSLYTQITNTNAPSTVLEVSPDIKLNVDADMIDNIPVINLELAQEIKDVKAQQQLEEQFN
jgi:hypothetical protein